MKKTALCLISFFWLSTIFSQNISGTWYGVLDLSIKKFPLIIHIDQTEAGYEAVFISPQESKTKIPANLTSLRNDSLFLKIKKLNIFFEGRVGTKKIRGTFTQNGMRFPLVLSRKKPIPPKRPQEPQKPYPYLSEAVYFENKKAGITLAGTLTLPNEKGNFPAVVLISGSSPHNRNEEMLGHKPFLVLADYLTRHGIAVLRYDDRGVGESKGDFAAATTADFATDTRAAVRYLMTRQEIDTANIGLIGHSEGGLIAPMVATESENIGYIVLLAGPGLPGDKVLVLQNKCILELKGFSEAQIKTILKSKRNLFHIITTTPTDSLSAALKTHFLSLAPFMPKKKLTQIIANLNRPWLRYFLRYDPRPTLQKVEVPVLALNGGKDVQVVPEANLTAIKKALKAAGNDQVTTVLLPNLNHLFQESETGLASEYGKIEQSFSPKAMTVIWEWIEKQTRK